MCELPRRSTIGKNLLLSRLLGKTSNTRRFLVSRFVFLQEERYAADDDLSFLLAHPLKAIHSKLPVCFAPTVSILKRKWWILA